MLQGTSWLTTCKRRHAEWNLRREEVSVSLSFLTWTDFSLEEGFVLCPCRLHQDCSVRKASLVPHRPFPTCPRPLFPATSLGCQLLLGGLTLGSRSALQQGPAVA